MYTNFEKELIAASTRAAAAWRSIGDMVSGTTRKIEELDQCAGAMDKTCESLEAVLKKVSASVMLTKKLPRKKNHLRLVFDRDNQIKNDME